MPISVKNKQIIRIIIVVGIFSFIVGITLFKVIAYGLYLSPDSYIYLDIAQNIYDGRGIVHSFILTSELDRWNGDDSYMPVSYWTPGFPLCIALIKNISKSISTKMAGASFISISFLLTIIIIFVQLTHFYNLQTGLWGLILTLIFYPLIYTYSWVWSDGVIIPFFLICLWLILEGRTQHSKVCFFLAGIVAGIAFSIRYILGILLPFGWAMLIVFCLSQRDESWTKKCYKSVVNSTSFLIGWACLGIPIVIRNIRVTGSMLGLARPVSNIAIWQNIKYSFTSLFTEFLPPNIVPSEIQGSLLIAIILLSILVVILRKNYAEVKQVFLNCFIIIYLCWALVYLITILIYASIYQIDTLEHRLLLPFTITMIIISAALFAKIFSFPFWGMTILSTLAIVCFCYIYPIKGESFYTTTNYTKGNPRTEWACTNTLPTDWIIGDSTFDLTLACVHRRSLCFVPGSYQDTPPDKNTFDKFIKKVSSTNPRIFILIRKAVPTEKGYYDTWIQYYGEPITKLLFDGRYEQITAKDIFSGRGFVAMEIVIDR
ncbi:MAG TPA: hypothetical protein PLX23_10750 [Candidatus Hydrogenedens sp.]|nr:hypothetical protein [Candidatus Hydrogenedens sp.]